MIVAWIFVTSLCCAFSLPVTRSSSDVRVLSKRNVRMDPGSSIDEDSVLEELLDGENKFEGYSWKDILSPQRLWSLHCAPNCEISEIFSDSGVEGKDDMTIGGDVMFESGAPVDEDIVLHLNADKDLMRFLQWTTTHLTSLHNASGNHGNQGRRAWIKLNLSGLRERPLYAEEPKYIVIRRDMDDLAPHLDSTMDIPIITSQGGKIIPTLETLKTFNNVFMPSRGKKNGKRDPLKDDLLFPQHGFPNRDKKFDDNTGELKAAASYTQLSGIPPFDDCFSRCGDIPSDNINELVPTTTLHLPGFSSSTSDAATDGHRGAASAACAGGAAAVAECQKQNDVKINGFDQSVNAQIHQLQQQQQPPSTGVAIASPHQRHEEQKRQRRLSSSQPSASVETGASSILPFIWSDQVRRVHQQPHPIRSGQWRDYYI